MPNETPDATPAAEEAAAEAGVDLADVKGSGAEGRVTKADVEAASKDSGDAGDPPSGKAGAANPAVVTEPAFPQPGLSGEAADEAMSSTYAEQLQEDKGFLGAKVDPTPDHAYTVEGVTAAEPTPETDEEAYEATRERRKEIRDLMTPEGTSRGREAD